MPADNVTILTSLSRPLTKTIVQTDAGLTTRTDQKVQYFAGEERSVDGIQSLAALLEEVSADPHKCVVRGQIAATANKARMVRRKLSRDGEPATLIETPRHWVLLDVDGFALPPGVDPFASPADTVRLVKAVLPQAFHHVTCWHQFTASAGVKPGLHIRLGFWLDRALGENELKWWLGQRVVEPGRSAKKWLREFPVDTSVFGTVQPNYVAKPIVGDGARDPLEGRCNRSGLVPAEFDTVAVPEIAQPVARESNGRRVPSSATTAGASFAECLAAIGDHEGGDGCHGALRRAVAVWWRRSGASANRDILLSILRKRAAEAEWDPKTHPPHYVQTEIDRLDSLVDSIQGQQRATELKAEEEFVSAPCPWPEAGLPLEEAVIQMRTHIDEFFDVAVPEGRRLRAEYAAARQQFEADEQEGRDTSAEAEFGPLADADTVFQTEEASEPTPPNYVQNGIKITAGAGKTQVTVARMVADSQAPGRLFVYAVPTHEKAEEVAALANKLAGRSVASVWRGVERDDPDAPGVKMCRRHDVVREIIKAGGSITDLCGSAKRGFCPFHPAAGGACGYRRQAEIRPSIWIVPHAFLTRPPPTSMAAADALIVDEAWTAGDPREDVLLLSDFTAPRKQPNPRLDSVLRRLERALIATAPGAYLPREPFEAEGLTSRDCRAALRVEKFDFGRVAQTFKPNSDDGTIAAHIETLGAENRRVMARTAFWRELASFLDGETTAAARLQMLPGDAATIRIRTPRRVHGGWLERPVLHLDATLDERMARLWMPRFNLAADIRAERGSGVTVRQVTDHAVSYGRIIPGVGTEPDTAERKTQDNTLRKILRKIEVLAAEDRRAGGITACVGPKRFVETAEETWKQWGTRPPNLRTAHFGALRGLNAFEETVRLIALSRPEPRPADVEDIVRSLFGHHPTPALATGFYPKRFKALRTAGNARSVVEEAYHPDALADACLRQVRDAEVAQAVHRARPVRRGSDKPLVIEIISSVAVDILVDHVGTFDEWLEESPAHVLIARGFWPSSWEGKQAVLRDLYPTAQAVRRGFEEDRTAAEFRAVVVGRAAAMKGAQTPYKESSIRDLGTLRDVTGWPRFKYRLSGARRSHEVAVDPTLHSDPRIAWEERLGRLGTSLECFEAIGEPTAAAATGIGTAPKAARPPRACPAPAATAAEALSCAAPIPAATPQAAAASEPPKGAEPLLTVDEIRKHVGISAFSLKTTMDRARYRRLSGEDRDRAAIQWMTLKVGREPFIAAVRELGAKLRGAA